MKYFPAFVLTLFVVILPLGSWYYLQRGLDYRRAALKELEPKGVFSTFYNVKDSTFDAMSFLKGKTTLVRLDDGKDNPFLDSILFETQEQYKEAYTYQQLTLTEEEYNENLPWTTIETNSLKTLKASYDGHDLILLDTLGQVRNYYYGDEPSIKKCVEHIAIVLPRKKKADLRMKDGSDIDAKPEFMKRENKEKDGNKGG